jgi:hypothetical protein
MSKGKGTGPSFRSRSRSCSAPGRPVMTRLTRTMGFVEISQSPCATGSIAAPGDDGLDSENVREVVH